MGKKKTIIFLGGLLIITTLLTGCVPGDGACTPEDPAGFFWGIWHGWMAPLSLIIGLFNGEIRLYEMHNVGWWYDFGFYIAILGGFGGFSLFRKQRSGKCSQDS